MNRAEYMEELAYLLQDVPDDEKEEALQYYEDYFDDAGPGKEADVIEELGRPEKLAAIIREGIRSGYGDLGAEYTERGYQNERYRGPVYSVVPPDHVEKSRLEDHEEETAGSRDPGTADGFGPESGGSFGAYGSGTGSGEERNAGDGQDRGRREGERERDPYGEERGREYRQTYGNGSQGETERAPRKRQPLLWLLIICSSIFWAPMLIGAAALLFGAALTVVCAAGGIALAVILIAVVCAVAGVIFIGLGIGRVFTFPLAGMMLGGAGLILFSIGLLAVWLSVWFCGRAVPWVVHLMGRMIHAFGRLFRRGGVGA